MVNSKYMVLSPADKGGCGLYRVMRPGAAYCKAVGIKAGSFGHIMPKIEWFDDKDIHSILTQRQASEVLVKYWSSLRERFPNLKIVTDFDDLLWKPHLTSTFKPGKDYTKHLDASTRLCNYITVSTIPLKEALDKRYGMETRLSPNMVEDDKFFPPVCRGKEKLRVLYMGSSTHQEDLEQIIPAVFKTLHKYDWVFMGYTPKELEGKVTSIKHATISTYLDVAYSVKAHVGIAPLVSSHFNECKSNVKLLEYGQLGLATVASSVYPYIGSGALMVNKPKAKEWVKNLAMLEDETFRQEKVADAVKYSHGYTIANNTEILIKAYS